MKYLAEGCCIGGAPGLIFASPFTASLQVRNEATANQNATRRGCWTKLVAQDFVSPDALKGANAL